MGKIQRIGHIWFLTKHKPLRSVSVLPSKCKTRENLGTVSKLLAMAAEINFNTQSMEKGKNKSI